AAQRSARQGHGADPACHAGAGAARTRAAGLSVAMPKGRKTSPRAGPNGGLRSATLFDDKNGTPRYMQLASVLRHEIASGKWPVGQRLPTVQQIAENYGLARITVRQAFAILAQDDLIVSERGRGTY